MSFATRLIAALLILVTASASRAQAQFSSQPQTPRPTKPSAPAREPVRLADRSVRATSNSVRDNSIYALKTKVTTITAELEPEPEPQSSGDPYGFAAWLNSYRAAAGLPPVAYDPNLSNWASQNNAAQSSRGLGHFVNPNCAQNCAWNISDAATAAQTWMNSTGHRRNMLSPTITRYGIAYGPGPYWTMNAQ